MGDAGVPELLILLALGIMVLGPGIFVRAGLLSLGGSARCGVPAGTMPDRARGQWQARRSVPLHPGRSSADDASWCGCRRSAWHIWRRCSAAVVVGGRDRIAVPRWCLNRLLACPHLPLITGC